MTDDDWKEMIEKVETWLNRLSIEVYSRLHQENQMILNLVNTSIFINE